MTGLSSGTSITEQQAVLVPGNIKGKTDLGEQERFLQADLAVLQWQASAHPYLRKRGCSLGGNNNVFFLYKSTMHGL